MGDMRFYSHLLPERSRHSFWSGNGAQQVMANCQGTPHVAEIGTFAEAMDDTAGGSFNPEKPKGAKAKSPSKRKTPVLLSNIDTVDYAEKRVAALSAKGRILVLACLSTATPYRRGSQVCHSLS